ncbi:MAG TPA: rod shape-determining protein MreC [Bacteroidetes bacterium]|nr:rod shape-determining protein MreC [Bacteroidota bacterium]
MPILFSKIEDAKDHILTGFLLVIAITLLVTRHEGGLQHTRVAAIATMSYLEQPLSLIRVYRTALQTNRELLRENILLLDELSRLRSAAEQNDELRRLLGYQAFYNGNETLTPVIVVGKNLTGYRNSITINEGSDVGIDVGMPVVNSRGLIGRVVKTSRNFAQVMPMQNSLFRTSANIQGLRAYGIVSWSGHGDELLLSYVPKTVEVAPGMIVETSNFSNQFPPNIPIGVITHFEPEPGMDTQLIYLEPFVDINKIAEGFVIHYQPVAEIDSLLIEYEDMFQ